MPDAYRVRLKRPRRRLVYILIVLCALLLYASTFFSSQSVAREKARQLAGALSLGTQAEGDFALTLGDEGVSSYSIDVHSQARVLLSQETTLPAIDFWFVALSENASSEIARAEISPYIARGAAGCVIAVDAMYYGIGMCAESQSAARAIADALSANEGISSRVFALRAPAITLRVRATQGQLEALLASDAALRECTTHLGGLATSIDAGETDSPGARGALFAASVALQEARQGLDAQTVGERESITSALLDMLARAEEDLLALSQEVGLSRTGLSGRVRNAQSQLAVDIFYFRKTLQGQR